MTPASEGEHCLTPLDLFSSGEGDFCSDVPRSTENNNIMTERRAKFKGYKAVVPEGDNAAVMEAVFSVGPLAVSIDASQVSQL